MQPDPRPGMGHPLAQRRGIGQRLADRQRLPVRRLQPANGGDHREGEAHQQNQKSERAPDDQSKPSHDVSAGRAVRQLTKGPAMIEFTAAHVVVNCLLARFLFPDGCVV
jgi:hypothetical protein